MSNIPLCCELEPLNEFYSHTNADVSVVEFPNEPDTDKQDLWVRKLESTPVDKIVETTQPTAVFIDEMMFHNGAKLVSVSRCCERCIGICNHSPLIEGQSLNEMLGLDQGGIAQVDSYRRMLLESMKKGGYFNQSHMGSAQEFYQARYGRRYYEALKSTLAESLEIGGFNVREIAIQAYQFLTESGFTSPLGMFPNDLNLTNILVRSSDNELRVIDQALSFTSPAVVICKLIIGWRGLATIVRNNPDWSRVSVTYLATHLEQTLELDRRYIQSCLAFYDWLPPEMVANLKHEVAAVQILKTFLTLIHYQNRGTLPPADIIEQVIGPFFEDTLEEFSIKQVLNVAEVVGFPDST